MSNNDIFYDTDCLSCFISIDDVTVLKKLFDKVIIPHEVYDEFSKIQGFLTESVVNMLINTGFDMDEINENSLSFHT